VLDDLSRKYLFAFVSESEIHKDLLDLVELVELMSRLFIVESVVHFLYFVLSLISQLLSLHAFESVTPALSSVLLFKPSFWNDLTKQ
jgi:hypothetical protein